MRIALINGVTTYWLAGEPSVDQQDHSDGGDVEVAGSFSLLPIYYVRADAADGIPPAEYEDKGNQINTVLFSTSRTFASRAAAELWAMDYDGAVPRTGTLKIDSSPAYEMAGAIVSPPLRRVDGCTVFLDYSAQGGALTEVVP